MNQPAAKYDWIGRDYSTRRTSDPRIQAVIAQELDGIQSVLNVGAGTGSYEPGDRFVVAVEPSITMINQRSRDAAPVVRAIADSLPFASESFDATLAILTMHHWPDRRAGLAELVRVARNKSVVFTWDPTSDGFWLVQRYFTEVLKMDRKAFSFLDQFREFSKSVSVKTVLVPHDCQDGFLGAYWRRPEAYLDPLVRASISVFSKIKNIEERIERLEADLRSGAWERDFGYLRNLSELDTGYRIVVLEK